MTATEIYKVLEQNGYHTDGSVTQQDLYSKITRHQLFSQSNRLNSGWTRGKYVVATYVDEGKSINEYLECWKEKAQAYKDQFLCLEEKIGEWKFYDYKGDEVGFLGNTHTDLSFQKISYGAPGTGKSCETNKVAGKYADTIRTTFHPDSDYSTFVGAYKPSMKGDKIVYKFIKQAFLKAYIKAWQKMSNPIVTHQDNTLQQIVLTNARDVNFQWEVTGMDDSVISLTAREVYATDKFKQEVKEAWGNCWNDDNYQVNLSSINRPQICVCNWMSKLNERDFEKCWSEFFRELGEGEMELTVDPEGDCKPYYFYRESENDIKMTRYVCGQKTTILKLFKEDKGSTSYQKAVANYMKEKYNSCTPDEAWQKLKEEVNGEVVTSQIELEPQYLVIEEINRGNCAQIFGDLFQLLDRKKGFSEYPIEADEDIQQALRDADPEGLTFGENGLTLPEEVKNELRKVFEENADEIIAKICKGKVLVLPSNLYIWATMNTSDQSLFPIDSAFKRRWDWEYVPIKNHTEENWKIMIGEKSYDWWTFLSRVNNIINELTSSEDKKLGYFFAKAQNKVVNTSTMVNKVFFYLWNDIFKDFDLNNSSIDFPKIKDKVIDKDRPYAFGDFFSEDGEISVKSVGEFMDKLLLSKATADAADTTPQPTEQTAE